MNCRRALISLLLSSIVSPVGLRAGPPRLELEVPGGAPFLPGEVVRVAVHLDMEPALFKFIAFGIEADRGSAVWFSPSVDFMGKGLEFYTDRLLSLERLSTGLGNFDFNDRRAVVAAPGGRTLLGWVRVEIGPGGGDHLALNVGACRCTVAGVLDRPLLDLGPGGLVEPAGASVRLPIGDHDFTRGDANADGRFDIADAGRIIIDAFIYPDASFCTDAGDVNDDGRLDVSDPVYLMTFLFMGGPAPRAPFPTRGPDPTPDLLFCGRSP